MALKLIEAIGNTPLVKLEELNPNPQVPIYAKLEYFNPTGSLKDRAAKSMIKAAQEMGLEGKTILEATSGNTGVSLAWLCSLKGLKCTLVLPKSTSPSKQKICKAFGAKLLYTSTEKKAVEKAKELAKNPSYFLTNQFANEANWKIHYQTTGKEIWKQTKGKITHLLAGIGTGGTLMGTGRKLKEKNPEVKVIGAAPSKAEHKQEGLVSLNEFVPEILKLEEIDQIINVEDKDALQMMHKLLSKEGLPVGISSGSVMCAAQRVVKELNEGLIVCVFADSAFRYIYLL